jgi:flagellar biosynthesis protein FlhA
LDTQTSEHGSHLPHGPRGVFARHAGLIVPLCIVGAVLVVVAPLPPVLMDLLLAGNITLAVVILLTATQVGNPLQFSVFPSLLLGTTLARLVLNIATTRLILTRAADHGTHAAGGVVAAFGDFVTAGSAAVGLILFLILVAIQFFVITKGATRVSEVAARFALDAMPGRQMAIDADLAAGALSADEARHERQRLSRQSDFYGAMDGAAKYVRGDAVAGIVITAVNLVGGLAIGVLQHGMSITQAAGVFSTLTIGDGLVSQLPAFLIAVATGLLVTRTSEESNLSEEALGQTFADPVVMYAAAGMLALLAFTGLPLLPMLCLAAGCGLVGYSLQHRSAAVSEGFAAASSAPALTVTTPPVSTSPAKPSAPQQRSLFVPGETEPLAVELGLGLLPLARQSGEESLVRQMGRLRERLSGELGFVIPKSRIRDNLMLGFREYRITFEGLSVATGTIDDLSGGTGTILPAVETAIRRNAHTLLTRPQVHQLLDHVRQSAPRLVEEVVPQPLRIGQVHEVLSSLLREQVPIRNLQSILGTLSDAAEQTQDVGRLTDAVRQSLGRMICSPLCRADGTLPAIVLDPMFEASLAEGFGEERLDAFVARLQGVIDAAAGDRGPVLVCRADLRSRLAKCLRPFVPQIPVLSRSEIAADIELLVVAEVGQSLLTNEPAAAA